MMNEMSRVHQLRETLPVFLDGQSTSPLAPEAHAAMEPWWHERAGNPNSPHRHGQYADAAVEMARSQVAGLINVGPSEIVFTSGATESNNLAIVGAAMAAASAGDERKDIVVSSIEHKSVLNAAHALQRFGFSVTQVPVLPSGVVNLDRLREIVSAQTLLVSIMAANNEIGSLQPLSEVVAITREAEALLHVDAAQMAGKLPFNATDFDYVSLSSHKLYGPMGVGALFVSGIAQYRPRPILFGGDQEGGLRPGTLATPLVVGFGAAAALAAQRLLDDAKHAGAMADHFTSELEKRQVRFVRHGTESARLPGSVSIAFEGVDASDLIPAVSAQISISEGSACQSGQITPSHVLRAIGLSDNLMRNTVRLYFGRYNSSADAALAADVIANAVAHLRLRAGDLLQ